MGGAANGAPERGEAADRCRRRHHRGASYKRVPSRERCRWCLGCRHHKMSDMHRGFRGGRRTQDAPLLPPLSRQVRGPVAQGELCMAHVPAQGWMMIERPGLLYWHLAWSDDTDAMRHT